MQEPVEGISFNFALLFYSLPYFLCVYVNIDVNGDDDDNDDDDDDDDDDNDVNTFL